MSSAVDAHSSDLSHAEQPAAPVQITVPHRCKRTGRALTPWIVHILQGKPVHIAEQEEAAAAAAFAAENSPAAAALSSPVALPFAAPTSKAGHESHDLRALSPEQTAAYANEYGKVEQAAEITAMLRALHFTDQQGRVQALCTDVQCHSISVAAAPAFIARLQAQQAAFDAQRAALTDDIVARESVPEIVVLNLCDGTEDDGYPGISIAAALQRTMQSSQHTASASSASIAAASSPASSSPGAVAPASAASGVPLRGLFHTGADPAFFHTTTLKTVMKECFARGSVRSARFVDLSSIDLDAPVDESSVASGGVHHVLHSALESAQLRYPLIVKPTSSYSSCGLSNASVVSTALAALVQAQKIKRELGPVLAEEFVSGREFSMLIVGDWNGHMEGAEANGTHAQDASADADAATSAAAAALASSSSDASSLRHLRCYTAAERVFTASLPPEQQFLTFEQNYPTDHTVQHTWWEGLDVLGNPQHAQEQRELSLLAKRAYVACQGRSYGRIDLRQDRSTGEFFCLEVNSLPGLSGELDSSVGAILTHAKPRTHFARFLYAILYLAVYGHIDHVVDEEGEQ